MPRFLLLPFISIGVLLLAVALTMAACRDIERASWQLVASPGDTDTTLQLVVYVGGCDRFQRFDVRETGLDANGQPIESVTIEAYIHHGAQSNCDPSGGDQEERTVELRAPLGDRTLQGCSPPSARYGSDEPNDDCASSTVR